MFKFLISRNYVWLLKAVMILNVSLKDISTAIIDNEDRGGAGGGGGGWGGD